MPRTASTFALKENFHHKQSCPKFNRLLVYLGEGEQLPYLLSALTKFVQKAETGYTLVRR